MINKVKCVSYVHSAAELLSDTLVFKNVDELLSSFHVAWKNIIVESKRAGVLGKTQDDFGKIIAQKRFKQMDGNIRNATTPIITN